MSKSVERALSRGATSELGKPHQRPMASPEQVQCKSCGDFEYVFRRKCQCGADIFQQAESELIAVYEESWKSREVLASRIDKWDRSLRSAAGLTIASFSLWSLYLILLDAAAHPFEPVAWLLPPVLIGIIATKFQECLETWKLECEFRVTEAANDLFRLRNELRLRPS